MMNILVTGGAGYIGSHTALQLLEQGYDVHIIDDLSNSSYEVITRIEKLSGRELTFSQGSVLDTQWLKQIMAQGSFDAVIHFAALKAVNESVEKPLQYYQTNVCGTLSLCEAMQSVGVGKLVFSSSAAVYGDAEKMPLSEESPLQTPLTPYGRTKLMAEQILSDIAAASDNWNVVLLRYFNPVGAHESGEIGEDLSQEPTNLMPIVMQVASGQKEQLSIFGNDYPTKDGSGVRDFIHVQDLASGHVKAIEHLNRRVQQQRLSVFNLGTGKGYSVKELVRAFEKQSGKRIECVLAERRSGDIAMSWADSSKAERELNWKATRNLNDMCTDAWRWYCQYPDGFK
ncbi:UDP-glucose 4-epimerase GalE [Idiomarina ramblicola]|uniref:UDP-glucose 4-epimerase n=1 Tax=Idiomarina ramblicola TaxID=263724 RepID=A0A432Z1G1_9GAMM|nr:UDP-glucose 4-epimerase GalE [Idiomarina ramblicola]RUO71711.1 UDP-glucose 4-epimerase GalE [Idiomarina ramblicola]